MTNNPLMKIDGLKGDYWDMLHQDEIELFSFSFGAATSDAGAGRATGKVPFRQFTCTKKVDKASSILGQWLITGFPIPKIVVTTRRQERDTITDYFRNEFLNCFVTSQQISGVSGNLIAGESLTFEFTAFFVKSLTKP